MFELHVLLLHLFVCLILVYACLLLFCAFEAWWYLYVCIGIMIIISCVCVIFQRNCFIGINIWCVFLRYTPFVYMWKHTRLEPLFPSMYTCFIPLCVQTMFTSSKSINYYLRRFPSFSHLHDWLYYVPFQWDSNEISVPGGNQTNTLERYSRHYCTKM